MLHNGKRRQHHAIYRAQSLQSAARALGLQHRRIQLVISFSFVNIFAGSYQATHRWNSRFFFCRIPVVTKTNPRTLGPPRRTEVTASCRCVANRSRLLRLPLFPAVSSTLSRNLCRPRKAAATWPPTFPFQRVTVRVESAATANVVSPFPLFLLLQPHVLRHLLVRCLHIR